MNMDNTKTWLKVHQPDICVGLGLTLTVAAVGTAIWKGPEIKAAKISYYDEPIKELHSRKDNMPKDEYVKEARKIALKAIGMVAKEMAIPAALEIAGLGLVVKGFSDEKHIATSATAALASVTAAYNALKYSDNGLIEKTVVKEDGTTEVCMVSAPVIGAIDKKVEEESKNGDIPVPAGIFTIKLDEENPIWKACNGDPILMAFAIKSKREQMNEILWRRGVIHFDEVLKTLEFDPDKNKDRFDWQSARVAGIIDQPRAYDMLTKQWIEIPGYSFKDADIKYGERKHHKEVLFGGIDWDYIYEHEELPVGYPVPDTGRTYYYIDINCDGNIANLRIEHIGDEETMERWHAHPELEK